MSEKVRDISIVTLSHYDLWKTTPPDDTCTLDCDQTYPDCGCSLRVCMDERRADEMED